MMRMILCYFIWMTFRELKEIKHLTYFESFWSDTN